MRFIIARHAQSQGNDDGTIQGQLDSPLTETGYRQIAALLLALSDFPITQIFSSPQGRAFNTARKIAEHFHCPLTGDKRLSEQNFGLLQGQSHTQALCSYREESTAIFSGDAMATAPNGESACDAGKRMLDFLESTALSNNEVTVGVVTHDHVLQALIWMLKGSQQAVDIRQYSHGNCHFAIIDADNGELKITRWGVGTHLLHLS